MSETIDAPAPADTAPAPVAPAAEATPPGDDWRASLPDDLKALPAAQKYATPADLLKGYVEAEKLIGRKGVAIPGENATPEEQAAFRKALGVPETPDAYALAPPEDVPAEVWSPDLAAAFAGKAHELGLTPSQAQAIAAWHAGATHQSAEAARQAAETARAEATEVFRQEWGGQFDAKVTRAQAAVSEFGGAELADLLTQTGLGNHPAVVRAFAAIGEKVAEDKPAGMGGDGAMGGPSPAEQARAIMADRAGPYWDALHRDHKATVERVQRLFASAR